MTMTMSFDSLMVSQPQKKMSQLITASQPNVDGAAKMSAAGSVVRKQEGVGCGVGGDGWGSVGLVALDLCISPDFSSLCGVFFVALVALFTCSHCRRCPSAALRSPAWSCLCEG